MKWHHFFLSSNVLSLTDFIYSFLQGIGKDLKNEHLKLEVNTYNRAE